MKENWLVRAAHQRNTLSICLAKRRIIPAFHVVDCYPRTVARRLHAPQRIGNTLFDRLVLFGHRDPITIIGHRHRQRHLQHPGSIDGLPKDPFRSARIADDAVAYFLPLPGKSRLLQVACRPVYFGGKRQAQSPGHLATGSRYIRRKIDPIRLRQPAPLLIEQIGSVVVIHLPSARERIVGSICIELRQQLLGRCQP